MKVEEGAHRGDQQLWLDGLESCSTTGSVWPTPCSTEYVRGREAVMPQLGSESIGQDARSFAVSEVCDG